MFYCSICWKLLYLKINKLLISFLEFFNDLILTNFIANLVFFGHIWYFVFGVFFFYTFISLVWKHMIDIGIKRSILFAQFYTEMLLLIIHRQCDCGYCINTCTKYMYISQNWLFINDKFTSSNMYILSSWSTVFTP